MMMSFQPLPTLDQDKIRERLARSKQTAGAFCESSLLRIETYGNRSPESTHCRLTYSLAGCPHLCEPERARRGGGRKYRAT